MTYLLPSIPPGVSLQDGKPLPGASLGSITRDGVTDFLNNLTDQYEKAALSLRSRPQGESASPL